jgi:hypothetical protein
MSLSQERGSYISGHSKTLSNKFVGQVKKIFTSSSKPLEWLLFLNNDLQILVDIDEVVRELAIQNGLGRGQIVALETLRSASSEEYQKVIATSKGSASSVEKQDRKESAQMGVCR